VRRGLSEADPLIRIAALQALRSFPQDVRFELAPLLLDDPIRGVRIEAAVTVADLRDLLSSEQSRVFRLAAEEHRAAQLASASRPESLVNLADFESATGNQGAAIDYLQHAVRNAPDFAPARHAFGLMLVRNQRPDEALDEFRLAAELAPEYSRFVYVLGVALNSLGHPDDALVVLTQARIDFPEDFDIGWALTTMLRDAGFTVEALNLANDLVQQFPANAEIAALRDQLAGSLHEDRR
jgi:tetratricopeptide (TPR) repeat protein